MRGSAILFSWLTVSLSLADFGPLALLSYCLCCCKAFVPLFMEFTLKIIFMLAGIFIKQLVLKFKSLFYTLNKFCPCRFCPLRRSEEAPSTDSVTLIQGQTIRQLLWGEGVQKNYIRTLVTHTLKGNEVGVSKGSS